MTSFTTLPLPRLVGNSQTLWDNTLSAPESLGCVGCIDRAICGGAHKSASFFDCNDYCRCPDKTVCDLVCRGKAAQFVERFREVRGFELNSVPRVSCVEVGALPPLVPLIEHKSARQGLLASPIVALSLYQLIDLDRGTLRYSDREQLSQKFGIDQNARLVISGVSRDRKIERYWALSNRPALLAQLARLDLTLITPPNFSVLTDVPRTDNLHAMKRILLATVEMLQVGLPTALHINARTERDYERWAQLIAERPEIHFLSIEFATGAGRGERIHWHVSRLAELAARIPHPLRLITRGGRRVLEPLRHAFHTVSMIDTDAFSKTHRRKLAQFLPDGKLVWCSHPTTLNEPLDGLLQQNVAVLQSHQIYLEHRHAERRLAASLNLVPTKKHANRQAG